MSILKCVSFYDMKTATITVAINNTPVLDIVSGNIMQSVKLAACAIRAMEDHETENV